MAHNILNDLKDMAFHISHVLSYFLLLFTFYIVVFIFSVIHTSITSILNCVINFSRSVL